MSPIVTLDWDNITISELERRLTIIQDNLNIIRINVFLSPTKGYHIIILFNTNVHVLTYRNNFKDDGLRVIHDIFNRPPHIHDVLWTSKTLGGTKWTSKHLYTIYPKVKRHDNS